MSGVRPKRLWYVNVYSMTRHYGGPEEGGWWYNAGEPLASVPVEVGPPPAWVPEAGIGAGYPDYSDADKQALADKRAEVEALYEGWGVALAPAALRVEEVE